MSNLEIVKDHGECKTSDSNRDLRVLPHLAVGFPSEDEFGILTRLS
jgi:hypothetical protein